ncbi:hypothetical protein [Helicobacter sp. 12S02634-8]|uniref:hypothetical protein n=1 Tax=Helicobacter sp. 12S02634-8 TaxID=1476199 RepID=UPI001553FCF2|nr:hypothetical protein [Helicobacter sp. 12S02634-8]
MQAIDWVGVVLALGVGAYGVYKIIGIKNSSKGCGCGGEGKCSRPKHYQTKDKK